MTALDRNDRIPDDAPPNKVKLEWITPKISLMEGGDTAGKDPMDSEQGPQRGHRIRSGRLATSHLATTLSTPANPNSTNGSAKTLFHAVRP